MTIVYKAYGESQPETDRKLFRQFEHLPELSILKILLRKTTEDVHSPAKAAAMAPLFAEKVEVWQGNRYWNPVENAR